MNQEPRRTVARCAGVSTLDQNCDLHLADLRRYTGQRFSRSSEYVDTGVSGAQRRPQLDALVAHARAMGKQIGRPHAVIDRERVAQLRAQGKSLREIGKALDVPVSSVRRALIPHAEPETA